MITFRFLPCLYRSVEDAGRMNLNPQYLHASQLQKAIRRNRVETAMASAKALEKLNSKMFCRRLAVTVLEDIGVGHPELVRMFFSSEQPADLIPILCHSPCNRDGCDLDWAAKYSTGYDNFRLELGFMTDANKAKRAIETSNLAERLLTLQALPLNEAIAVLADLGLPPEYQYIIRISHKQRLEGLGLPFGVLALQAVHATPTVVEHRLPPDPIIKKFYASTYCMHTRAGCAAIRKWKSEIAAFKPLPVTKVHELLFTIETGALLQQARYSFSQPIEQVALYASWQAGTDVDALLSIARAALPRLHDIRREVA